MQRFHIPKANVDGSDQVRLTLNQDNEAFPTWSPDGARIAYVSRTGEGSEEIYVMNSDGSDQVPLADLLPSGGFHKHEALAWSPDGARIAFHSPRGGADEIYVINAVATTVWGPGLYIVGPPAAQE